MRALAGHQICHNPAALARDVMSLAENRVSAGIKRWRGGVVIAAAALIFTVFAVAGALPFAYAIAGFVVVAAAVVVTLRATQEHDRFAQPTANVQTGDDSLRT